MMRTTAGMTRGEAMAVRHWFDFDRNGDAFDDEDDNRCTLFVATVL